MNLLPNGELFGGKELAASGEVVSAITLDSNVVIYAGAHREHEFRIENEFTVQRRGSIFLVRYDPYNRSAPVRKNLTELSAIVATTVGHARAYMSGILELDLGDQTVIAVQPMSRYEAWTYTFEDYILACPPGGFAAP